jgi:hypothetical protein
MNLIHSSSKRPPILVVLAITAAILACGPTDLARDILGRLPTVTPSARSEEHTSLIWYVAPDGDDANGCRFPEDPCRTIHGAIAKATEDDEIRVAAGTYSDSAGYATTPIVVVTVNLAIIGEGSDRTFIDGHNEVTGVSVRDGARLRLENVTIQNGGGRAPGGCLSIRASGSATVRNSVIRHCSQRAIEHMSDGSLHLTNVTVTDALPYIDGSNLGPGIASGPGALTIENSEIHDNSGVGIRASGTVVMSDTLVFNNGLDGIVLGGDATLTRVDINTNTIDPRLGGNHAGLEIDSSGNATVIESTIQDNDYGVRVFGGGRLVLQDSTVAGHPRPGILIEPAAVVTLENVIVTENGSLFINTSVPGGIDNRGQLTIRSSRIEGNRNGGILVLPSASLLMQNSTIDSNRDDFPGLWNNGDATITASTISRNEYMGIENRGTIQVSNSTISGNLNNGITATSGALRMTYVTVADNGFNGLNAFDGGSAVALLENVLLAGNAVEDCEISSRVGVAPIPQAGMNLDSDGTCLFGVGSTGDPSLDPLADNGGPTQTHALREGSPAIDAASGGCPISDQRGTSRPVGGGCDVGAFEFSFALTGIEPTSGEAPQPPVMVDLLCWAGPGPGYNVVSSIKAGTLVQLLGTGLNARWLIVDSPRFPGVGCWVEKKKIDLDPAIDLSELHIFPVPPLPTPTPVPGCLYQGPNDPQAICYPLSACPVPFDQSLGACTP